MYTKKLSELKYSIEKFLNNECNYEFLEDYILEYAKNNKISINYDYIRSRILDIYNIKGKVGDSTITILINHIIGYFEACHKFIF